MFAILFPYFHPEVPFFGKLLNPILVKLGSWNAIVEQAIAIGVFLDENQSQLNLCMYVVNRTDDRVIPDLFGYVENVETDEGPLNREILHMVKRKLSRIINGLPMVHRCGVCGMIPSSQQHLQTDLGVVLCPEHSHIQPRRAAECPYCGYRFDPENNSAFHEEHSCANCNHLLNRHVIQVDSDGDWFVKVKGNRRFLEMSSARLGEWILDEDLFEA